VDPSSEYLPIALLLVIGPETGNDHTSHRPHVSVHIEAIPDVPREIALVRSTGVAGLLLALHRIAKAIYLTRAIRRPDRNPAPMVLKGFEQFLA